MDLNEKIKAEIFLLNVTPLDSFLWFSPFEMDCLLYDTFGEKSPLQFREDIDDATLDQIPSFRIAEEFLKIIQRDKQIKLTPLGALPKKVVVELYDTRFLLEYFIENGITKLWKEENCIAIQNARIAAQLAGLAKKVNGKLSLTKSGSKLLEANNRVELFKQYFKGYTKKFSWGFNDGYTEKPVGQLGWAFSAIVLEKLGTELQPICFYSDKYINAFPHFLKYFHSDYSTPEDMYKHCFQSRTFERFFLWFGFAEVERMKNNFPRDTDKYKRSGLISKIFNIEV